MEGIWRTVGGRRIFIAEGQSLSDAMKKSKKFEIEEDKKERQKVIEKKNIAEEKLKKFKEDKKTFDKEKQNMIKNGEYPSKRELIQANSELNTQNFDKQIENAMTFEKDFKGYKFKNKELEQTIIDDYVSPGKGDLYWKPSYSNEMMNGLKDLDNIASNENLMISKSPYSQSFYAYESGEISWDSKPENSYRLADHWNFESQNTVHCKLKDNTEYTQKVYLAQYKKGTYEVVNNYEK